MIPYILLFFSVFFNTTYSSLHNYISKHEIKTPADNYRITAYTYGIGTVLMLILSAATWSAISVYTALFGIAFGIVTALNCIFMLKAFASGPMSFTVLIMTSSVILSAFSGAVIWQEPISPWKIIGTVMMIVAAYFTAVKDGGKASLKWLLYSMATFLCTGSIGVMQKFQQNSPYASESTPFLTIAFLTAAVSCLFMSKASITAGAKEKRRFSKKTLLLFGISGLLIAFLNVVNLYLSGVLPSALMFPMLNGGTTLLSVISAILIFREKLNLRKSIGLSISLIALILLII